MSEEWRLLNLGMIDTLTTQSIYHAIALSRSEGIVPDTLILCSPSNPVVCVGYHQEIEKEIRVSYCEEHNIPIVRRSVGGGAVLLDSGQQFYQFLISRDNPKIPKAIEKVYEKLLRPVVKTYNELEIPAKYKPVNDIEVEERKISGNGAGEIENTAILVGNFILDFDYANMVNIFKVPSEKFRDKLAKSLQERITTIKRELGYIPEREKINNLFIKNVEEILDVKLVPGAITEREKQIIDELNEKYRGNEWLYMPSYQHAKLIEKRKLKVSGRTYIAESVYKSPGGLIRITAEIVDNVINDIFISGDFTFVPTSKLKELENRLIGLPLDADEVVLAIDHFYRDHEIQAPGTTPDDITKAIIESES